MPRALARCAGAAVCGSLAGLVLAGFICWVWLATVDGAQTDWSF